jgi:glycosyltransferase involved in cell wall biosynthesis
MKTVIIVPVFNEELRVVDTIKTILKNSKNKIIIIDDGSTDNSFKILKKEFNREKRVLIINHAINLGKGAAMKTGAEMAWKLGAEAIVFIDADGQHDPKFIKAFEDTLKKSQVVFGYRELGNNVPWVRRYGNFVAKKLIGVLFNVKRKDLLCGFFGFRKSVYEKICWTSSRYAVETEIATKVGKLKIPYSEIKIDTIYLDKYKGVSLIDAIKVLIKIPYWYFRK